MKQALRSFVNRYPRLKSALRPLLHAARKLPRWSKPQRSTQRRVNAFTERGRHHLLWGRHKKALAALQRARRLQPDHIPARKLLGWLAIEQRNWPEAAVQWRAVLATLPAEPAEQAEALNALALALIHTGEFSEAADLLKQLEVLEPGRLPAQELRLVLAQKSLDDKAHAAARADYAARYPEAAAQSPAWLRFAGGEDGSKNSGAAGDESNQPPRYTEADLEATTSPQQARLILAYLELRLPHREYLKLARKAMAAHSAPVLAMPLTPLAAIAKHSNSDGKTVEAAGLMTMEYLYHLLNYLSSPEELAEAQDWARTLVRRLPENPRARRLLAESAVAANDRATVAKLLHAAGGGDLELWLAAAKGDHARARAVWQRTRRRAYLSAIDGRGLNLRLLNQEPTKDFLKRSDRILLFTAFRNERVFAPWFLDYYRRIGVEWFFIVDNMSSDGTADYLAKQKDVTVFESRDNYAWAHSAMKWINELLRRYGDDHWCVYVDSDEQLVVPCGDNKPRENNEGGALRLCVDSMAARGEEVLPAYMLDTYPADLAALKDFRAGDDPLFVSSLIDPDIFFFGKPDCPFFRMRGGVRDRLFGFHSTMEKAPVLRGGEGRCYITPHNTAYAKVSQQCAVLLHHKLMREALDMMQPGSDLAWRTDDRGTYCRIRHEKYRNAPFLAHREQIPRTPNTVAYQNATQLQSLKLIGNFNPFRKPTTSL